MGFGLPSTIGASLAMNNKRSITIIGDGGFQLNVQELQTIVTNKLKVKVFIFQNNGYHAIRVTQDTYFGKNYVGSSMKWCSYAKYPENCKILHYKLQLHL